MFDIFEQNIFSANNNVKLSDNRNRMNKHTLNGPCYIIYDHEICEY